MMYERKLFTAAATLSALVVGIALSTSAMAGEVKSKDFDTKNLIGGTVLGLSAMKSKTHMNLGGINAVGANVSVDKFRSTATVSGTVLGLAAMNSTTTLNVGGIQATQ
ncbi:hypothetical protein GGE65_008200 [Skermanella aerolata]|uniref:hypothetical protein n=1 Tax=Skermanella aerolata TaxID=393310 RepID=UPI003D25059C